MDIEQIRAFVKVVSHKSFSGAAEKLYISQPSVSVKIKALEEELGVILFDRSKAREPVLTEEGRIFLDYAYSIVDLHESCREKLSGQKKTASGPVYIGASTVPGTYLLPAFMANFKEKNPSIDLNLDILDTSAVLEGVLNYSYDLGFVGLIKEDDRLKYVTLASDDLVLCTKKGLIDTKEEEITVEKLMDYHLLMRERGSATRRLLEKELTGRGFDLSNFPGITYINNLEGLKQAVKKGLGVAVISSLSVQEMVDAEVVDLFKIKDLDLSRYLYLVYHCNRVLNGAAKLFRDNTIEKVNRLNQI